jgi:hypothetical protein
MQNYFNEPNHWIISPKQDLLWFQGAVLAGLTLLLSFLAVPALNNANYTITHPAVLILVLWGVLFDGTHVWGTYARTYFAPDASSRTGLPRQYGWWLFVLGPCLAVLDYGLLPQHPSLLGHAGWLFQYFLVFAYLWAYWHLVRQHYGFMVLYRRKAGETQGHLDTAFLWIGSLYPYLRFSLSDAYLHSGLPQLLPVTWLDSARIGLDVLFAISMLGLLGLWLVQRPQQPIRVGPKQLFLGIVVSFHLLVFSLLDNLLTITATLTIFHNFQYHRIVWQYEQGHGRIPMKTLYRYLGFGIMFGFCWYVPRILGVAIAEEGLLRNILLGLGWGIAFHHYLIDARIWRVRRTPEIAQVLDAGAISRSQN